MKQPLHYEKAFMGHVFHFSCATILGVCHSVLHYTELNHTSIQVLSLGAQIQTGKCCCFFIELTDHL